MATSDSEDFESADEDFEFEKSKEKHLPKKADSDNTKDIDNSFNNAHINEGHSRNEEPCNNSEKDITDKKRELTDLKEDADSGRDNKNNDGIEVPVKPETGSARSLKPKRPQQVRIKNETSSGPKKLGTRVSISNKVNDASELQLMKSNNQSEPEINESSVASKKSDKSDGDFNLVKEKEIYSNVSTVQQNTDSTKEIGDGWEVEEEDGFEIPSSLHEKQKRKNSTPTTDVYGALDKISSSSEKTQNKGWGGWGSFGMSSLLSTATESVSALSSHVTAGLSTVTSVLDSSLGAPDPEDLAKTVCREGVEELEKDTKEGESSDGVGDVGGGEPGFTGFGSLMSGVSLISSKVITGGLDTLETIGKKTMEVLQDGDPRLMKKRAMFFQEPDKPVLSQILREAKEKAENSDKEQKEKEELRQSNFEALFDDFQGMVHLEALEMLSKQCQLKLQSTLLAHTGEALVDLQETLSEVKQLCELPEESEDDEVLSDEEFASKISEYVKGLHKSMTGNKIIQMNSNITVRIKDIEKDKIISKEMNKLAISTLAEFTALAMEIFHKSAELLLTKQHHSTADEAESLILLTCTLCSRISTIANMFTELLTKEDPIANSATITNIYKESTNSGSYIQNACQLLLPVIQVGATS